METMRRRGANSAFGLASSDEEQRKTCVAYYRHLQQKINHINTAHAGKVIALELHAAPMPATQMLHRPPTRLPVR